jgi:hypothetical protein
MNETRARLPLLALAMLSLLAAMWAGLTRIGWSDLPPLQPMAHGPLMLSGFLGTLIGLERAVALSALHQSQPRYWSYAGPFLTGLAVPVLLVGQPFFGALLITLGSLGLVVVFGVIVRQHPALYTATMGLGAVTWCVGNALWLAGWPIAGVVPWWIGFLVLTVAGERLELARLLRLSGTVRILFLVAGGLFVAGLLASTVAFEVGMRLTGAGMLALALWLLRHDIARHTVYKTGLTRFVAICLLSGYVWLGVGGVLGLLLGGAMAGPTYDAILHAIFLGFAFPMIFGHAPIIFPAVLRRPLPFQTLFYAPLILLHLSLLLRVVGDLALWMDGRQWGGLLNVVAILFFLANTARAILRSR